MYVLLRDEWWYGNKLWTMVERRVRKQWGASLRGCFHPKSLYTWFSLFLISWVTLLVGAVWSSSTAQHALLAQSLPPISSPPQRFALTTCSNPVYAFLRWCLASLAHRSITCSLNSVTINCSLKWKISIKSMLRHSGARQLAGLGLLFMVVCDWNSWSHSQMFIRAKQDSCEQKHSVCVQHRVCLCYIIICLGWARSQAGCCLTR